jgi:hypothetical protein
MSPSPQSVRGEIECKEQACEKLRAERPTACRVRGNKLGYLTPYVNSLAIACHPLFAASREAHGSWHVKSQSASNICGTSAKPAASRPTRARVICT